MPPEIVALIDKPWLLALVLAIGAACGIAVERIAENMKKAERRLLEGTQFPREDI